MTRKQQAGEGGQGLLGAQDSPPPVSPGAHTVFIEGPRVLEAWAAQGWAAGRGGVF